MAKKSFDLNDQPNIHVTSSDENVPQTAFHNTLNAAQTDTQNSQPQGTDPNAITVSIADQEAPIVVLFGPAESGKTMTLIRLTQFLKQHNFKIVPNRSFRPAADTHYAQMCNEYDKLIFSTNAAEGTKMISFMLVDVLTQNGKKICQILEAPGEHYFNPKNPNEPFRGYINTIINSKNRKIWLLMTEPNWRDPQDRNAYVSKIHGLKRSMKPHDSVIFLYNKVDMSNFVISPGKVNIPGVKGDISNMYPGIFTPFTNQNPITKWFKPYLCGMVPFSNGSFPIATNTDGTEYKTYQPSVDDYPLMLWNAITKQIKG